ncbi:hypothetical protein [Pelodictyon phaeoclathratiforme]|uniref:Uncharacterized protein n=1 Tax=Pelodictyon phaeoclathratiforme (strain DSM 5477 / BU-1) TaxID=324925 RepID=B4SH73_PELPB|nr:hypothetical protein [Pelodictyon phaeoclathratiforme]ACF43540.1 hypothetical protein Ppha_1275 [Pelodictyon phaeoclathratiforme BU-1]
MSAVSKKTVSSAAAMGKEEQESLERNRKRALYQATIEQIVEGWAVGKPILESTGKPSGYYRLTNYLRQYIIEHESLPKGIHTMPEGRDSFNNIEPSFPVDFNSIIGDITLPE